MALLFVGWCLPASCAERLIVGGVSLSDSTPVPSQDFSALAVAARAAASALSNVGGQRAADPVASGNGARSRSRSGGFLWQIKARRIVTAALYSHPAGSEAPRLLRAGERRRSTPQQVERFSTWMHSESKAVEMPGRTAREGCDCSRSGGRVVKLKISKLDAARRQIETAIVLYFHEADPVSIHTLSAAAHGILLGLSRASPEPTAKMIYDALLERVKPEFHRTFNAVFRESQNFFKHADRDHDAVLERFTHFQTEVILLDACAAYRRLSGESVPLLNLFWARAAATWAREAIIHDVPAEVLDGWAGMSKMEFFAQMLPIAYQSAIGAGGQQRRELDKLV
jgi:hypothetical protein